MIEILNKGQFINKNTMIWKRILHADISRVWSAISTEIGLSKWYMPTKIDLKVGGKFSHEWTGHIGALKENKHIQFNNGEGDHGGITRFEIQPYESSKTVFSLIDSLPDNLKWEESDMASHQPGGPGTHWVGVAAGWHDFVDRLEMYINGQEPEADLYTITEAHKALQLQYDNYLTAYHASHSASQGKKEQS